MSTTASHHATRTPARAGIVAPSPVAAAVLAAVAEGPGPVCDGCRTRHAPGGWRLVDDGAQLCPDCWRRYRFG